MKGKSHPTTVKLMAFAGQGSLAPAALCSLESHLLSIAASRLQWLHEQLLRVHFTCPQPDVPEAEVRPALHSAQVNAGAYLMQKFRATSVLLPLIAMSSVMDIGAV